MNRIVEIINEIQDKKGKEKIYYRYCNIEYVISFNNIELKNKFQSRVYPFMEKISKYTELMIDLNTVVNNHVFEKVIQYLKELKEYENLVASYCTKESGMVRIKKFMFEEYIIILSSRKEAIWILKRNSNTILFIGQDSMINHFHREFYLFFEHIITKKCISQGAVMLHAAAVERDGKVVLLIGNKRSGKTTTFFELCKNGGYRPLSVDKVLIDVQTKELRVYGVPTRLRVLAGTLSKYPELYSFIPDKYKNASDEVLWQGASDGKVEILIRDFEKFVHNQFSRNGNLRCIVFGKVDRNNIKPIIRKGYDDRNKEILKKNIYSPINPEEDWWSEIGMNDKKKLEQNRKIFEHRIEKEMTMYSFETKTNYSVLEEALLSII